MAASFTSKSPFGSKQLVKQACSIATLQVACYQKAARKEDTSNSQRVVSLQKVILLRQGCSATIASFTSSKQSKGCFITKNKGYLILIVSLFRHKKPETERLWKAIF